jgi:N4-gp56 family major capsid protein
VKFLLTAVPAVLVGAWLLQLVLSGLVHRFRRGIWSASFLLGEAGGIDAFVPEIWSKKLLSSLKKSLVYGGPGVVNTDYEGEIADQGDTVHINSISRPTIGTYVKGSTTITPEQLTAAQRTLVVDQAKYFAFEVDDVDARQAAGNVIPEAMTEAAYGLRDVADQYLEALMRAGVISANALGAIACPAATPANVYDNLLIPLEVALDEANVPTESRFCIIPPWVHGRLQRDDRFIDASKSGKPDQAMGNGFIGEAASFKIYKSNNAVLVTGDDYSVIAGHPMATSYAEQINKTEAYRPQDSFSDAVKGLHLYGAKVVRPYALATALASKT